MSAPLAVESGWQSRLRTAPQQPRSQAKISQAVDAAQHLVGRHRTGNIVKLVAVGTRKVATARWDYVGEHRMPG